MKDAKFRPFIADAAARRESAKTLTVINLDDTGTVSLSSRNTNGASQKLLRRSSVSTGANLTSGWPASASISARPSRLRLGRFQLS